jgi:hypothetical protein
MCSHHGCNCTFKSKKQKNIHHDKAEDECRNEKNNLIKIAMGFKETFEKVIVDFNLEKTDIIKSKEFISLEKELDELPKDELTNEIFISNFGDKL